MQLREVDWEYWLSQKQAKAWQCLALSVDVEPRDLGTDHFLVIRSMESGRSLLADKDEPWLHQLCARLEKLHKDLAEAPAGLRAGRGKSMGLEADLKLSGFACWAKSKRMKLPKALAALATPSEAESTTVKSQSAQKPAKAKKATKKSKKA